MLNLSEYTVLDLSWLLPGPYGTRLLSDLGMEVIKVEEPESGDYARWIEPEVEATGLSYLFHTVNRNKKSVTLDLTTDEGTAAFLQLAEEADVVFEQFRPGVVAKLGIDYDTVREVNEEVVYCSLTGYGQDGPYSNRVGHDINYSGIAGLLDKTKFRDSDTPTQPGFPIGDMAGGLAAAFSIVIGLLNKELGHGGQYFDVSMTDIIFSMGTGQEWEATYRNEGREIPDELLHPPVELSFPCHTSYQTADGEYITIGAVEEKFWDHLLDVLDREDLADYQFARGERAAYAYHELSAEFEKQSREAWEETFSDEVPFGPVNHFKEAFEDDHLQARELIETVAVGDQFLSQIGFPIQTSSSIPGRQSQAPLLGEHSRDLLSRVMDSHQVASLIDKGIVSTPADG
jgi:alpha-methylacyl-CoA racemase